MDADISWVEVVDFNQIESVNGLPHGILDAIAYVESRYNPLARSSEGARGAFQFMPATARHFHVNPLDPIASARAARVVPVAADEAVRRERGQSHCRVQLWSREDPEGLPEWPSQTNQSVPGPSQGEDEPVKEST